MGKGEDALKGAAGGAATGAAFGPWGAAIGGVVGGALGYFGSSNGDNGRNVDVTMPNYGAATRSLANMAGVAQNRLAPQLDQGLMMQSRGNLYGVANRLGEIANGQQAGAGELAVNRQLSSAYAQQQSAARMARGANSALAARNAMRNSADMGLQGAGAAAQAQMQDQQAANQQLGQIYSNLYGQDTTAANMNLNARLSQQQMNDAYQIQSMGQLLGWDQAQINANLAKAGLPPIPGIGNALLQGGGQALAAYAVGQGRGGAPANGGMTPSGSGGGGVTFNGGDDLMPLSMSDERVKKNINDGSVAADRAISTIQPLVYQYHNPTMGAGTQLGITTQGLQRAGLGQAVVPTPAGDAINPGKLAGANTAMIARLGDRIDKLEARNEQNVTRYLIDTMGYSPTGAAAMARKIIASGEDGQRIVQQATPPEPSQQEQINAINAHNDAIMRKNSNKDEMLRSLGYGLPANYAGPVVQAINAHTSAIEAETARKNRALGLISPGAYYPPGTFSGSIYPVGMGNTVIGASPRADMGGE